MSISNFLSIFWIILTLFVMDISNNFKFEENQNIDLECDQNKKILEEAQKPTYVQYHQRARISSYGFFIQECRAENPDKDINFFEFSEACSNKWKSMTDEDKERFHDMARKDLKRYESEMADYRLTKEKDEKLVKKDISYPKRWMSAFFYFTLDERPKIVKAKPNFNIRDVARELGKRWVEIDKAKKAKYTNMSKSDQVRFLKELKAYERKTRLSASSGNDDTPGEASTSE